MRWLWMVLVVGWGLVMPAWAQEADDLLELLEQEAPDDPEASVAFAAFKATRLVQQHSAKLTAPHHLDFLVTHRFGNLLGGFSTFFGLDNSASRIAFEYGLHRWVNIGVGRSTYEKSYDGFVKVRLLSQGARGGRVPLTVTYLTEAAVSGMPWPDDGYEYRFVHRFYYTHQLLIARKFSQRLSLQVMPTFVHRNLSPSPDEANDALYLGMGGRFKLSEAISLNLEWSPALRALSPDHANPFGLGIDIETGGHVFQLTFTNGRGLNNKHIFFNTVDDIASGKVHFGFNMFRTFSIGGHKEAAASTEW